MAKYYVACGSQTLVLSAPSPEFAAMRLMDEALAPHAWIYTDSDLSEQTRRDHLVLEALLHLGSSVMVSEIGWGQAEAGEFGVPELLEDWHRLMTGLSYMISSVGLVPRSLLPAASADDAASNKPHPR